MGSRPASRPHVIVRITVVVRPLLVNGAPVGRPTPAPSPLFIKMVWLPAWCTLLLEYR